jgi:hypothetical protein
MVDPSFIAFMMFAGIIMWLTLVVLSAVIAASRGENALIALFGAILVSPFVVLLWLGLTPVNQGVLDSKAVKAGRKINCPECREAIHVEASRCSHCAIVLTPVPTQHSYEWSRDTSLA